MRLRRFRSRLLVLIVGLLVLTQCATYFAVSRTARAAVLREMKTGLMAGVDNFDRQVADRMAELGDKARLVAGDFAFRQTWIATDDPATLRSALENFRNRINASPDRVRAARIVLMSDECDVITATGAPLPAGTVALFEGLASQAAESLDEQPMAIGLARVDGGLHGGLVVPLFAPFPEIAGWLGFAFPIDGALAGQIKAVSRLEVSYFETSGESPLFVSTLAEDQAADLTASRLQLQAYEQGPATEAEARIVRLGDERFVTLLRPLEVLDGAPTVAVFQRSLDEGLAPVRRLELLLLATTLAGLVVATGIAVRLARDVDQPVQRLARHTRTIASGDYATRVTITGAQEFEELAASFNSMSTGLAERDRVRDLLDKNVSPEIAAWLMRDGAALGGEEREVTILFADLRGFTTLCESLPAPGLVHMLNRYLDRMSAAIEAEGGVIDKFIGDAIMAVFGAPVAQEDAADRALRAALRMRAGLEDLNREFATEGRPPLGFGIGINSDVVVAGNIGSQRRLNYSVIGDGVNVAARLETLTRKTEYAADVLASARTLEQARGAYVVRELGTLEVKGRIGRVGVVALDGLAETESFT